MDDTTPEQRPVGARARGPVRGDAVDRFTVLGPIGEGGMGVVVAAYDGTLDRKVALKLLRPGAAVSVETQARLLREAQAMARLSHANVVTVYDAGTHEDRVFLAMELVNGQTLGAWLRERHGWRDVVRLFLQAGRGLAAAHAAGLVHRDFKPDNVLVARDGTARVTDFGLAGVSAAAPEEAALESGALAVRLTRTGTILGTPAYMAPEQLRGEALDARADQFAFCVALYEALYGVRPFTGGSVAELLAAVEAGRPAAPLRDAPRWLGPLVLRGLRPRPEDRWPSLAPLLEALARDPAVARRRAAIVGAFVVLAGAATAAAVVRRGASLPPCRGAEARLAGAWDGPVKQAVRAAFTASGRSYAADTFGRVAASLDRYTSSWTAMRTEACEATEVRKEQSAQLLDLRMWCLDARRDEVVALTTVLGGAPSPERVDSAVKAVAALTPLAGCADAAALLAAVPPPADPALRLRVEALRARLLVAEVTGRTGAVTAALAQARQVAGEARALGHAPLQAQALDLRGQLEARVGEAPTAVATLNEAAQLAAEGRDDHRAAQIWVDVIYALSRASEHRPEALALEPVAHAAITRAGGDPLLRGETHRLIGNIQRDTARFDEADRRYRAALESFAGPDAAVARAYLTFSIAHLYRMQSRNVEALALLGGVRAVVARTFGPEHYDMAIALGDTARVLLDLERCAEALPYAERALAMSIRLVGEDSNDIVVDLETAGDARACVRDEPGARAAYGRARALAEREGPTSLQTAGVLANYGMVLDRLGRFEEAIPLLERARTLAHDGKDAIIEAMGERYLGESHLGAGRPAEALVILARAAEAFEALHGDQDLAASLLAMAKAHLALRRPQGAVPLLERALALQARLAASPSDGADARFQLARALWDGGGDRARALALAREADASYAALALEDERGGIHRWLAAHGGK